MGLAHHGRFACGAGASVDLSVPSNSNQSASGKPVRFTFRDEVEVRDGRSALGTLARLLLRESRRSPWQAHDTEQTDNDVELGLRRFLVRLDHRADHRQRMEA